ncbi:glycosyltransferase family 2 protein [Neptuniibacter sp. QD34_54]|uniref:glycosyltransferase family 2 protein n=1 Tax=Neptuniibacter sp. QD34_54 TaxID=3398208 RepID=UPI0039F5DB3B
MALVSIITPVYNSSKYIENCIESVKKQDYTEWEHIFVDDCSTDNSVALIEQYACDDSRIKILKLDSNSGPAVARNLAIREAKGRFIAFLDSDDQWLPHKLQRQISFMLNQNVDFCFSSYVQIDGNGREQAIVKAPESVSYNRLLKKNVIGCLTAIYDTKSLGKVYMPLIRKRQDFGLWLKILKKTDKAHSISEPLAKYRVHELSVSANKRSAATYTWKLYREIEHLSLPYACYCFICYALEGLYRSKLSSLFDKRG